MRLLSNASLMQTCFFSDDGSACSLVQDVCLLRLHKQESEVPAECLFASHLMSCAGFWTVSKFMISSILLTAKACHVLLWLLLLALFRVSWNSGETCVMPHSPHSRRDASLDVMFLCGVPGQQQAMWRRAGGDAQALAIVYSQSWLYIQGNTRFNMVSGDLEY